MLKTRIQTPVTLLLAVAMTAILWGDVSAAARPMVGAPTVAASIGVKPVVRPTTGEPEGSGNNAPIPKPELQRVGKELAPQLEPEEFWELLIAWLTQQVWRIDSPTRHN